MIRLIFIFASVLLTASCSKSGSASSKAAETPMTFEEAFKFVDKQIAEKDPTIIEYLGRRMAFENSISLDFKGNCYAIPGKTVTLVSRINQAGVIDLVIADAENERSECFKNTYLNTRFDSPPVSPIYRFNIMLGEDGLPERFKNL
ncbi:MAG TPA: hypothetical protein PKD17_01865 [Cellvibrionaceae bacterium]|nr:hypothetical protein [Cellvibrionaceae bacterium]HMW70533.1 hypothetical protein [Cellvibrionaceae bacterium]HMY38595.1 hypothetical protein [Marinagarivorans sp.]HNG59089.1 hypothetical protein [Cellvibrionaceae bacterium]